MGRVTRLQALPIGPDATQVGIYTIAPGLSNPRNPQLGPISTTAVNILSCESFKSIYSIENEKPERIFLRFSDGTPPKCQLGTMQNCSIRYVAPMLLLILSPRTCLERRVASLQSVRSLIGPALMGWGFVPWFGLSVRVNFSWCVPNVLSAARKSSDRA